MQIKKILKENQELPSLTLQTEMKLILVPDAQHFTPIETYYPIVFLESSETLSANLLDHVWFGDQSCVEICGIDKQKNYYVSRSLSNFTLKTRQKLEHVSRRFKALVITLSDRASRGEYDDLSGKYLKDALKKYFDSNGYNVYTDYELIGDDEKLLRSILTDYLKTGVDFIFTTGGTGIGPRDITVPIVQQFIHYELPGIMDLVRIKYGMQNPAAVLSRSLAGIVDKKIIFCLPGSLKAVKEYFSEIEKILLHAVFMLNAIDKHS